MNPFSWIRSKVAQAVVDGFDDAMTEIGAQVETDAPLLRSRLSPVSSPALPAAEEPDDDKPTRRKRA